MVANKKTKKNCREVKAILQSLQQIGTDRFPEAGAASESGQNVTTLESLTNRRDMAQTSGQPGRSG